MSVQEYTLKFNQLARYAKEMAGSIRAWMRKFAFGLSDDLVLECQGAMLNRDMDFARLSVHMQQVDEKKKKIAESKEKDRQAKRARIVDQNHSQQQSGRCLFGTLVFYSYIQPGHIQRDCLAARSNIGGSKSQANSSAPPPPQKGATSASGNGRNRLSALTNCQEAEASLDIVPSTL
ncbi:uncharacterized protein LOC124898020 [Capsicum annuum]|uniref:uncharacterized protein LOC124898020 n=1 Tax=Capsicum annuum TaxID=4072 RepID=UPI001FB09C76|nr:uncharacterized protein LOC124898020 [Capsicum annuum]